MEQQGNISRSTKANIDGLPRASVMPKLNEMEQLAAVHEIYSLRDEQTGDYAGA
jgi:hypothetical protein